MSPMATVCGGSTLAFDGCWCSHEGQRLLCGYWRWAWFVSDDGKYSILTDIAGAEDHYGDMDFKVAGTREGITALQMDIKVTSISIPMMREALAQAKKARLEILDIMEKTLNAHRENISLYAPRLYKLSIPTDKIRDLIGPGGKKIKSIIEQTGVKIDVLEDGTVHIFSTSGTGGKTRHCRWCATVTRPAPKWARPISAKSNARLMLIRRVRRTLPRHRRFVATSAKFPSIVSATFAMNW